MCVLSCADSEIDGITLLLWWTSFLKTVLVAQDR